MPKQDEVAGLVLSHLTSSARETPATEARGVFHEMEPL